MRGRIKVRLRLKVMIGKCRVRGKVSVGKFRARVTAMQLELGYRIARILARLGDTAMTTRATRTGSQDRGPI